MFNKFNVKLGEKLLLLKTVIISRSHLRLRLWYYLETWNRDPLPPTVSELEQSSGSSNYGVRVGAEILAKGSSAISLRSSQHSC
jgi:hypothetical protein